MIQYGKMQGLKCNASKITMHAIVLNIGLKCNKVKMLDLHAMSKKMQYMQYTKVLNTIKGHDAI